MSERIYLGLGSNLGDRLHTLQRAVDELESHDIRVLRSSRVYETEPVGGPPQGLFLNAVIEVATDIEPLDLLGLCLAIETELGRVSGERWGPRTCDIDILSYGEQEISEPVLTVPHPLMHERAFVLVPLLELDADPFLPGGRKVSALRLGPDVLTGVRPFAPPLRTGTRTG
ncbi:MAG: 2-amino-4-hydroxy-6-hydroxymethyldihydropteridine diphosphokinase [Actinomycetota bacterium]